MAKQTHARVAALLGLALAASAAALSAARAETVDVTVDRAKVIKVPAGAATIVIGNPIIAEVLLLKDSGSAVVTGKGYGTTNIITLDATGRQIDDSVVHVTPAPGLLVVQRGMERQSYSCRPVCMPTVQLGDQPT
ncbi:MAG: pilus assembly protein N-terminal domain-containing protein, partial [Hyphomicrobiales bacterium]|nr:pilus assembly protein N-terminal domain-containing protein [Hyphomicrobiales bacterium]